MNDDSVMGPRGERRRIPTRVGELAVRTRGDGPPAVLWHSLFVDERSWKRVEEALARDRRLVIINGPGHGESVDPDHRYSLDDCAAAAGEVLAALEIDESVDWVGNAWGGHVGVVFASSFPDRCRTLATFGTPIEAYGRSERWLFRVLLAAYRVVGMVGYLSTSICDALLSPRTRASDPEAVALVLDSLRTMRRRALANAMVSISLRRPDLTSRLSAIRCPTLFVTGADHPEWTPEQVEAKIRLLAAGSAAVVPDTAYLTPLEAPEATIKQLRELWTAPSDTATHAPAGLASAASRQPLTPTLDRDPVGCQRAPSACRARHALEVASGDLQPRGTASSRNASRRSSHGIARSSCASTASERDRPVMRSM